MSFNNQLNADKLVNEFLGLCQGLIADDDVSYSEMEFLKKWLTNNQEKANSAFINQIADKIVIIERANPDQHPDEQKALLKELCITLKDFTGSDYELGEFKKSNQLSIDNNADIFIDNHNFVLTGKFTKMSRKEIESKLEKLGGNIRKDVSSKTHFLVIGDYASTDWKHSSYGNKIKYAEKLRHDGIDIKIISEAQLYDALDTAPRASEVPQDLKIFTDDIFVLTGEFETMTRANLKAFIITNGGDVKTAISKKTTHLIIGQEAYEEWDRTGMAGKKIKDAVDLYNLGCNISIIAENTFFNSLSIPPE